MNIDMYVFTYYKRITKKAINLWSVYGLFVYLFVPGLTIQSSNLFLHHWSSEVFKMQYNNTRLPRNKMSHERIVAPRCHGCTALC